MGFGGVNLRLIPLQQALSLPPLSPQFGPSAFTMCPHAFVVSWTPAELEQRRLLYEKAFNKARRVAAFLPDERIAFE
jgi:hypothetical protein